MKPARGRCGRQCLPPHRPSSLERRISEKAKGLLMNRLSIDLMDTTAFNYVQGGLLIEAAKQGPCLLSDCVARNDERVIDSRATGLKDEAPSLSRQPPPPLLSFFLPCAGFSFCVVFFRPLCLRSPSQPFVLNQIKLAVLFCSPLFWHKLERMPAVASSSCATSSVWAESADC